VLPPRRGKRNCLNYEDDSRPREVLQLNTKMSKQIRIFIVDDHDDHRMAYKRPVSDAGYQRFPATGYR
jgi:hypothetical protein